jgi:transglutaminase-like putative cysteine protease
MYESEVTLSQQYLHLTPRKFNFQHTDAHKITITPMPSELVKGVDYFGNNTNNITITTPHHKLSVLAETIVSIAPRQTLVLISHSKPWNILRDELNAFSLNLLEVSTYLYSSPHVECGSLLKDYALPSFSVGRPVLEAAFDLMQRIHQDFEFDDSATEISTPLEEVLRGRRGVCQDFAQLMIGCLRSIGVPARYVSGYILTHPPEGQLRLIGADASHAWVSVFCPILGWVDFDPTNGCLVQYEHITIGWGRDYSDVTPLRGVVLGGGNQELQVNVTVMPT